MIIFKHAEDLKNYLKRKQISRNSIGFLPTMGALHDGHLSLLKECKLVAEICICSIFVNPTQFNNKEDFKKYPKSISNDILVLEQNKCDVLFLPGEKEIYPDENLDRKHFDLGDLETIMEGKFRPGHFQGVSLVVEKLLDIVNPDFLFLGQKDFQQCLIIKRLINLMNKKIKIIICPIVREENGLARSSRNLRLNPSYRNLAAELYRSLISIKNNLNNSDFPELKKKTIADLEKKGFKVEYLELAQRKNLELVSSFDTNEDLIILIAAFLHDVRLIDNVLINP